MSLMLAACYSTLCAWVMGVRHREFSVEGVQFHPESILTEGGHALLRNFLAQQGGRRQ